MNKICRGCGALFQSNNPELEGFIKEENKEKSTLCERCFKIRNYGEYQKITKKNDDFFEILKQINETGDLVVLVIDIFNINKDIKEICSYFKNNDVLVVLNKRDVLPLSVKINNLLAYVDRLGINYIDKLIISTAKNYNFDLLMNKINTYKKSKNVYVVGFTNVGKSSMINKIIYNYSDSILDVTTSVLPSTTLSNVKVDVNENLTLIDTPGIIDDGSIMNYLEPEKLKKVLPRNEIRTITYQIRSKQSIFIEDLVRIDCEMSNNLTLYFSNKLDITREFNNSDKLHNLEKHELIVFENQDIVISGLGFIKATDNGRIIIYTVPNVDVFTRPSLI
mgnify:FL=1